MNKRKCIGASAALLLIAILLAAGTALERQQQRISDAMIRIHVVANSDSEQDQQTKLTVRDAVLEAAKPMLEQAESQAEARAILVKHLCELEAAANKRLMSLGIREEAKVTLGRELFGTREYDGFTLPGGYYDALRVTIGAGEGKNWWCVVYPQICLAATADSMETVAVMGGMNQKDYQVIANEDYELRLKSLELLEGLLGWIRSGFDGIPVSG